MSLPISPYAPPDHDDTTFRWDEDAANKVVSFIERLLCHTKGRHAKKPFILAPWQKDEIVRPLFGTMAWDDQYDEWTRQYGLAWIEMARKNGKSELAAALALYFLLADGEHSAEVYCVASDVEQAGLVFSVAEQMVLLSPTLSGEVDSGRLEIVKSRRRIIDKKKNGLLAVLPGDAGGALGTNPSAVIMDEVLTQKDRHLFDAMRQGFGTRRNPMMVCITTAAYTSAAFALEEHKYSQRVEAKPMLDPGRFVFLRNTPKDWDWTDEGEPPSEEHPKGTGWYYGNPALGDFLNLNSLRKEAKSAAEKPMEQNAFRVFRLNQWVAQAQRWIDMGLWDENGRDGLPYRELEAALKGRQCYGGLDLAATSDVTAWVLLFPGTVHDPDADAVTILPRFFIPRAAIERRTDMVDKFTLWEQENLVHVIPGRVIDYDLVYRQIEADALAYNIVSFGYDPWNATQTVQRLEDAGLMAVQVPQTAARLNDPCKRVETLLAERSLCHHGNPVLAWMADNVELDVTPDGLMKPSRSKSGEKIDGIAAMLNSLFVSAVPVDVIPEVTFISFNDDEPEPGPIETVSDFDRFLAEWGIVDNEDD